MEAARERVKTVFRMVTGRAAHAPSSQLPAEKQFFVMGGIMWAKFDDQFYLNPKNATMTRDEQDVYMAGLIYCNGQLTDGFIPAGILPILAVWAKLPIEANAQAIASQLVEHCFWEISTGGYMVHDFLDWNMSKEEALALKSARSDAGKRGGKASVAKRQAIAQASAQAKLKQNSTPTQTQYQNPIIKESHTQTRQFSESLVADKLIMKITGWIAIPPSDENLEFMRDVPTILQQKGDKAEAYLTKFWAAYKTEYPGSTRLAWIGWSLTGQIPTKKPVGKNGKSIPESTHLEVFEGR